MKASAYAQARRRSSAVILTFRGRAAVLIGTRTYAAPRSEAVLLLAQTEGLLAALHNHGNLVAHRRNVDRALELYLARRVIACVPVVAAHDQLSISIDHEVRVVAREDELALALRFPDQVDNFEDDLVVEVVLGLVDYQWRPTLVEQHSQQRGGLLAG